MGVLRRSIQIVAVAIITIVFICTVRTVYFLTSGPGKLTPCSKLEGDDYIELTDKRWQRLKASISYKTISYDSGSIDANELDQFVNYLIKEHPIVFKSKLVSFEKIADYSLLIHVKGRDDNLLPYMLAAHLDVVPVIESQWSVHPFNGTENADKTIVYGRGTLDDKGNLMSQLAALESLLQKGHVPERSFYLAFGHDEEIMGHNGAKNIARRLKERGVNRLHFILDEGTMVMKNMIPGMKTTMAAIGVSEKGFMNLNISVEYPGGHSSMPRKESAISILGGAVQRLQSNQIPGELDQLAEEMLLGLAEKIGFPLNFVLCNLWLFKPVVAWAMSLHPTMQGTVRTTTAVTIFQGGTKSNVIPTTAWAIINHRIHPRDSKEKVLEHVRKTINDDRVHIETQAFHPAHPISPFDRKTSLPYQVISDTVEQLFQDTIVIPAIMVAATDTKHYLHLSENVYRFNPFILEPKDVATIHAEDEYISKENFGRMINFFYHIMINADRAKLRYSSQSKGEL